MSNLDTILARFTQLNATTLEKPLSVENVVLEAVKVLGADKDTINTQATLRPLPDSGFTDSILIGWRRIRLDRLFYAIPVVIRNPDAQTTRDLIPILNAMYGTTLTPTDVLSATLPPNAVNANVVMTANPASLYITGSFTLRFTKA